MRNIQILFIIGFMFAQTTVEGIPKSYIHSTSNRVMKAIMPDIDVDQLLLEDKNAAPGTPFRYGKIFDVDYSLNNSGTWEVLDDGDKIWRLEIHSKYAYSIGIEYDYFHLPEGAEFYVYNAENGKKIFSHQLDYVGSSPPTTFSYNEKQWALPI